MRLSPANTDTRCRSGFYRLFVGLDMGGVGQALTSAQK